MILPERPFLGCPVAGDLTQLEADVVVIGIPHGVSYVVDEKQRGLATAPSAVREASRQFAEDLGHQDFEPRALVPARERAARQGMTALTATRLLMLLADSRAPTARDPS